MLNSYSLASVAILLDYFLDAHFFNSQQVNDFLRCLRSQGMTSKVVFQLKLSFGNLRHFLSFDLFSILDDFADFQEIFLSM